MITLLSDEEIATIRKRVGGKWNFDTLAFARAIEAATLEKIAAKPAVAGSDEELIKTLKDIWWRSNSAHMMRKDTAMEIINTVREASPRITEQDMREIFLSATGEPEFNFRSWFNCEGRALLDKLTGKKS